MLKIKVRKDLLIRQLNKPKKSKIFSKEIKMKGRRGNKNNQVCPGKAFEVHLCNYTPQAKAGKDFCQSGTTSRFLSITTVSYLPTRLSLPNNWKQKPKTFSRTAQTKRCFHTSRAYLKYFFKKCSTSIEILFVYKDITSPFHWLIIEHV